jgi:glycosyltransferase involved in cell wall biosynthesis
MSILCSWLCAIKGNNIVNGEKRMDVKVSVIIPVYNGEHYLEQCLDTVCNQTLREIEIICVDDGSIDSSPEILKRYAENDERIQILYQSNQFAGVARNNGKKHATGEYLIFWDCDDYFELDALEVMYKRCVAMDADVCVCGVNQYFQDKELLNPNNMNYLNRKRIVGGDVFSREGNEETILNFTNAVPWNKMFRRQYIEDMNLDFQAIRNGNDIYFTMNAIYFAKRITTVKKPLINYRCNQSESLFGTLAKSPLIPLKAWIDVAENFEKLDEFPERTFANKAVGSVVYLLRNMGDYDAFCESVAFLKKEGLDRLHLQVRTEEFYYSGWHNEFIRIMRECDANVILAYLEYMTYQQLVSNIAKLRISRRDCTQLKKEIERLNEDIDELSAKLEETRNSWSFKIGQAVVWLPGKIKRLFR